MFYEKSLLANKYDTLDNLNFHVYILFSFGK